MTASTLTCLSPILCTSELLVRGKCHTDVKLKKRLIKFILWIPIRLNLSSFTGISLIIHHYR